MKNKSRDAQDHYSLELILIPKNRKVELRFHAERAPSRNWNCLLSSGDGAFLRDMKHFCLKSTLCFRYAFMFMLALLTLPYTGTAATLPVSEDSFGYRAKLTVSSNKAGTLPVDGSRRAFLFFDLHELPAGATIRSARLRLFLPRVIRSGSGLELHNVTGPWDETLASAEPTFDPVALATIGPGSLRTKGFFSVDLTAVAQTWLANPQGNEGLAITAVANPTPALVASLSLGAKEGSGSGYPAELDVELDTAANAPLVLGSTPNASYNFNADAFGLKLTQVQGGSSTALLTANPSTGDVRLGIGGAIVLNGNSSVRIDGALTLESTTISANFTANNATCVFFCNTANNSVTITLPDPTATPSGRFYIIKKISANNTMTITTPVGTIEGATTLNLTANNAFRTIICNGQNWFVIGQ